MELLPSLLSALKTRDPRSVEQEFNVLRSESLQLKKQLGLTSEVGAQKENIKKNRYKDILPYDQCRVVLSQSTTESSSDYINASFIRGVTGDCRYVACQGPLGPTLVDFWRMIWQLDIKVIVMACREIEMGKKKCECYWASAQRPAAFGPFTISSQGETHMNPDVVVRALTVSFQQETRSVVQYQFVSWPDHDVPYETDGVLDLLRKVRGSQGPHSSPLLVHCSAGCGRTGVICALDYINDLLVSKCCWSLSQPLLGEVGSTLKRLESVEGPHNHTHTHRDHLESLINLWSMLVKSEFLENLHEENSTQRGPNQDLNRALLL